MKKFILIMSAVICSVMMLTACSSSVTTDSVTPNQRPAYSIFVGLADNESKTQKINTDEAIDKINQILIDHKIGFTVLSGGGSFLDNGKSVVNSTLVYPALHLDEKTALKIINQIKDDLNLYSVYVLKSDITYGIFGGEASA